MKRRLISFFFIFCSISILCISCKEEDPVENIEEKPEEKIEYYVKYESSVYIPSSKVSKINIEVRTDKGMQSLDVPLKWEGIYGPFYDLEELYLSSKTGGFNVNMTNCRGRISICRGNQPFILKVDESFKGTKYAVSYKVTMEDLK